WTAGRNLGYYVLGPTDTLSLTSQRITLRIRDHLYTNPDRTVNHRSDMVYTLPLTADLTQPLPHTLLLRQLVCPYLQHNPLPGQPGYVAERPVNPYVPVDYLDQVPTHDAITRDANGTHTPPSVNPPRASWGRRQPYAAHLSQQTYQQKGSTRHMFFGVNNPRD